jgi:hypothetical protein
MKYRTGKNRNLIDQFYTRRTVSKKCIEWVLKDLNISENDLFIEPSAGNGSFSDFLFERGSIFESYDIDPKKNYIVKKDFLSPELGIEQYASFKYKIHCIGNPPFGSQSSMARKFIKKCCLFCDTISFILPKSFRKESYQKSFPLNFHLIKEYNLEKDAFILYPQGTVPSIVPSSASDGDWLAKATQEIGDNSIPSLPSIGYAESSVPAIPKGRYGTDTCGGASVPLADRDNTEKDVPFIRYDVPCVFQIWEKRNYNRFVEEKPLENGFRFVKKPKTLEKMDIGCAKYRAKENVFLEEPHFAILRAGGGNTCGRISLE